MNTLDSISDGPVGHEKPMRICGFIAGGVRAGGDHGNERIAGIARQLQNIGASLSALHATLTKAHVAPGQPQRAQAGVVVARRIDPNIQIHAAVPHAVRVDNTQRPTER